MNLRLRYFYSNTIAYFLVGLLISANAFSQVLKKDTRSKDQKENSINEYQSDLISKADLLNALEIAGIRIFKFQLATFDKEYKMTINVDEYVEGKKINTEILIRDLNTYEYYEEKVPGKYTSYKDYLNQLLSLQKIWIV